MTGVRILKETAWGGGVEVVELVVDTSNDDQFKVQVLKTGTQIAISRVQRYDGEGSRLFLRYARKNKSRAEAERLAMEFMQAKAKA